MACCAGCEMTIGDASVLPTIVWPSDVTAYKRKLEPQWNSTDGVVRTCAKLPAAQKEAWALDFAAWKAFDAEDVPIFGSANKYDEAKSYESRLAAWQQIIKGAGCELAGPAATPPGDAGDVLKWVAAAAIVVAVVYGVTRVVR